MTPTTAPLHAGFAAESLERRILFDTVDWIGGASGNWNDPSNWSGGAVPGASDDVRIIAPAGQVVVTLDAGDHTIRSLEAQSVSLNISGDALSILEGGTLHGALRLSGGALTTAVSTDAKLLLGPLSLFEMSGGVLRGDLELGFVNGFRWTGGEMASPGATTVGEMADPYSFIHGGTSTPVLSRPLLYGGRDLWIGGSLLMHGGLLDFRGGSYFLFLSNAQILDGSGDNLLRTSTGFINASGESRIHVPADIRGMVGFGTPGILHLLSTGSAELSVSMISELHVGGDGYALDVHGVGPSSYGEVYIEAGHHTVQRFDHHGDLFIEGADTRVTFSEDATAALLKITSGAEVNFAQSVDVEMLKMASGGRAHMTGDGPEFLRARELFIFGEAMLDIGRQSVIVDYDDSMSPQNSIRALLANGYAGGLWTGGGICSEHAAANAGHAVGYAEAADIFSSFPAEFAGVQVDDTSILLTHTLYGDANLDRVVDLLDFNRLAANFGVVRGTWSQGNFNYDSAVNLLDFNRLASQFGKQVEVDPDDPDEVSGAIEELAV